MSEKLTREQLEELGLRRTDVAAMRRHVAAVGDGMVYRESAAELRALPDADIIAGIRRDYPGGIRGFVDDEEM